MTTKFVLPVLSGLSVAFLLTGCLTQRTVTDGTGNVQQGMVIKRPVKEIMSNSR